MALAGLAIGLAIKAHQASPEARRPAPLTMPMAVSRDLEHHQHRFGAFLRLIQEAPAKLEFPQPFPLDSAHPEPVEPMHHLDADELDEEVNRSAIAPVRWV